MNSRCLRVAVIMANDSHTAAQHIEQASLNAEVIEWRLDYWRNLDFNEMAQLRRKMRLPVIFTLRKKSQGGRCERPQAQRWVLLQRLAELSPDYLDLEYDTPVVWLDELRRRHPHLKIIGSYHDFTGTPDDLPALIQSLRACAFDLIKIATFAHTICDTLRLLIFLRENSGKYPMIGLAMGEYGQISRILAPVMGGLFTYGCLTPDAAAAPGQLTMTELTDTYRVHLLNRETAIYGLLGDPIEQSPGHIFHNHAFASLGKNAVYVKCRVQADVLGQAISLLRQLPFFGFSVTIPHKETITTYLDGRCGEAEILSIANTIHRENHRYLGFNTDAAAAVAVLENKISIKNQRVLILGAGGSGKAIAYQLLTAGAAVTLCNRTLSRAQAFIQRWGGAAIDFDTLFSLAEFPYDIVINTLPAEAFAQQCAHWRLPAVSHGIALDITLKPLETLFIQSARAAGWRCLTGDSLFNEQAIRQLRTWFQDSRIALAWA
jgi:shikimate dehydrogenase/3-dehydroquinate dehydratase type I